MENNTIFVGKVPINDMPYYYAMGNVFVTASKSETQGLTVIEALAASLPVVAINDESFSNVITDDLNGYLFKNKSDYIKSISKLVENKEICDRMSKQAYITSLEHSLKYYAEKILSVYSLAIKNKKKKNLIKRVIEKIKRG